MSFCVAIRVTYRSNMRANLPKASDREGASWCTPSLQPDGPTRSEIEVKVRSAVEARPLALSGWPTAVVSAVDEPGLAIDVPTHLSVEHLVLIFDDVTSDQLGTTATVEQIAELVNFGRRLPQDSKVLVHCRGGIGRSPACALAIHAARGLAVGSALTVILKDRPQAQPNPLIVLLTDEALDRKGRLWHDFHLWAFEQPWWHSGLRPDRSRSLSETRHALVAQTHRKRPKR